MGGSNCQGFRDTGDHLRRASSPGTLSSSLCRTNDDAYLSPILSQRSPNWRCTVPSVIPVQTTFPPWFGLPTPEGFELLILNSKTPDQRGGYCEPSGRCTLPDGTFQFPLQHIVSLSNWKLSVQRNQDIFWDCRNACLDFVSPVRDRRPMKGRGTTVLLVMARSALL